MYTLFDKKGELTKREAYSFGLSDDGAAVLELSYHLNKQGYGYTLAEMIIRDQQQKQAEREEILYMMALNVAMSAGKLPAGPEDPDFRLQNGKYVQTTNPSGYISNGYGWKVPVEGAGKINDIPLSKLQHEFKHSSDFGVTGNWNKASGEVFNTAIRNHINSVTNPIKGTYRGTINVTHYYNPATGVNAMVDSTGNFVAGWKLSPQQITNLLKNSNVQ